MKYSNIFLIFALLLYVNSTKVGFEFASFAEVSEVSNTAYGKSLLETINLKLQKGGDIASVAKLLDFLLFRLNRDQEDNDSAWIKEKQRLDDKIDLLKKQIALLEKEIRDLVALRQYYEKLRVRVIANLKQYNAQYDANIKQLRDIQEKRQKDSEDFHRSKTEHLDIIKAISTVLDELAKLLGSISGEGKPEDVREISQEKRDRLYKSLLQISKDEAESLEYLQLVTSTKADQFSLNQLIEFLKKLRDSAQKSFNNDKKDDDASLKAFESLSSTLNNDNLKLGKMIEISEKNLKVYSNKIDEIKLEIIRKERIKANKEIELKNTIKEREVKEYQYNTEKEERNKERQIINKLQEISNKRIEQMYHYLNFNTAYNDMMSGKVELNNNNTSNINNLFNNMNNRNNANMNNNNMNDMNNINMNNNNMNDMNNSNMNNKNMNNK